MKKETLRIRYGFDLPDGSKKHVDLRFDPKNFRLTNEVPAEPPFWTELKFSQCANCPLNSEEHPHCPSALHMAPAVELLKELVSFDTVGVTVTQSERTVHAETSAQQPFASEAETVYRSVCMFLLARYLKSADDSSGFAQLKDLYENLHIVNRDMSRRLGAATRTDPARNAMALLDSYTTLLPAALESSLQELKPLFDAWRGVPISSI
jgi:hypothetical protein